MIDESGYPIRLEIDGGVSGAGDHQATAVDDDSAPDAGGVALEGHDGLVV